MKNYQKIFLFLGIFVFSTLNIKAQSFPGAPEPWRTEYDIDVSGVQFVHPMTVVNQAELNVIKDRISNNIEPQTSAYNSLISEATIQLSFVPNAPSSLSIPGGYVDPDGLEAARIMLFDNGHAAYTCALAFALTDNATYAEKAREVLMDWANTGTTFTGDDKGLQLGSYFSTMLYAADLIYNYAGWSSADKTVFRNWWKNNVLLNGEVQYVSRVKDNNWKDAGLLGLIAAAVVLEDSDYLKEALIQLKSYFFERTDASCVYPGPTWKITKDSKGVYMQREVERSGGEKGITYSQYALTSSVQAFEIARYCGFDYYNMQTEVQGATLQELVEWLWRWDLGGESWPFGSTPNRDTKRRNSYEWANTRFSVISEMKTWIESNRPLFGREGDEYCTLTRGDMVGVTPPALPAAPSSLVASAVSQTQIDLSWTDNASDEDGFKIERHNGGSFIEIATVGANVTSYNNTNLGASTSYTYRVRAYNAGGNSTYSNEASATTQDPVATAPAAPSSLVASTVSQTQIDLSWTDNASDEDGFKIERHNGGSFIEIATVGANVTSYSNTGLTASTTYTYRVYAYNTDGNSANSNEASATTQSDSGTGAYQESGGILSMEAENGEVGSRWNIGSDGGASGSAYIEIDAQYNTTASLPECTSPECIVSFNFDMSTSGNYRYWFRIYSTGGDNDSFFWRVDDGAWIKENGRNGIGNWFSTDNTMVDNLTPGNHTLEIAYRENGTRLDKFVIQLDSKSSPTGDGPPESSRGGELNPPVAPSSLVASAVSQTQIDLSWTDNASDEDGFKIERHNGGSFIEIATVGANVTSYSNTGLTASTTYTYRVRAYNAVGNSTYSNETAATTQSESGTVPAGYPVINSFSAAQIGNTPEKLLDGDNGDASRWSASGFPQWVIIDYGAVVSMTGTRLWTYKDRAYKYKVELSDDLDFTGDLVVDRLSNTSSTQPISDDFAAVNARYAKITVTGASGYTGSWVSLTEFNVVVNGELKSASGVTAINNLTSGNIKIYPNPLSNQSLTIEMGETGRATVSIYEINGRLVYTKVTADQLITLERDIFNSGLYLVKIANNKHLEILKLSVK